MSNLASWKIINWVTINKAGGCQVRGILRVRESQARQDPRIRNEPQILCSSWTRLLSFQHASVLASYLQRYSTNNARQLQLCLKNKDNPCGSSVTVLGRTLRTWDGLCFLWTQFLTFAKVETHSAGSRGHDPLILLLLRCLCLQHQRTETGTSSSRRSKH